MSNVNIQVQQACLSYIAMFGASGAVRLAPPAEIPSLSKYLINIDEIKFDGTVFDLNSPIQVALYRQDGLWNCEYEACGVLATGDTPEEAVRSFYEDFTVLWDEIAMSPDDSLTNEALQLKRCVQSVVKSVKTR